MSLAPYATHPETSRGRLHMEKESASRNVFQRDRDRIIHSTAFRRLEYKTQVFVNHEGDHYRTRLTHSLEVAQLARSICRSLRLNEDLAEALALAHDLGHTPFGHAGEDALAECMAEFGGFSHNAHTLRILTLLEQRYAEFDGLNLTWETLEGVAKHNGPVQHGLNDEWDLELHSWPGLEAQVAAMADDIAYNNHDVDDGLRAGLFTVADLDAVPQVARVFHEVAAQYPGIENSRLIHESIRRLIHAMVSDFTRHTHELITDAGVKTVDDVRKSTSSLVGFSPEMQELNRQLKAFLHARMYRHYKVNRMSSKARRTVTDLFRLFLNEPECLPTSWRHDDFPARSADAARLVADYIAGMTDRFALKEHQRLFDVWERS